MIAVLLTAVTHSLVYQVTYYTRLCAVQLGNINDLYNIDECSG